MASHFISAVVLFLWLSARVHSECSDTVRVRKPWHSLSDADQLLYAKGFQRLNREGTLVLFLESHDNANVNYNIHTTPQNFFWHSYWLFELENSFRDLGAEYDCFTMPYWDVTHDAAYWSSTDNPQSKDLPIYTSNLGGEGDIDDNYCVTDKPWTVDEYDTEYLCADSETSPHCCLKRYHLDIEDSELATHSQLADVIFVNKSFMEFDDYAYAVDIYHSKIHTFIGSVEEHTHFNPSHGEPEVDPLFPLFHTFIDYIRLLREDCNQFDLVNHEDLDDYVPYSYSNNTDYSLDYEMTFSILCDGSNGERKRLCSTQSITPRFMFDTSPNRGFGITYELGDFWSGNEELKGLCANNLNASWWSIDETEIDEDTDAVFAAADEGVDDEEAVYQFVNDHVLHSVISKTTTTSMVLMVVAVAALALLRWCAVTMRKKTVDGMAVGGDYGAI